MAKQKDELTTDEFKLDPELDFDFNTDIDGSLSQEAKSKSRNPVLDVFIGAGQVIAETVTSPSFFKPILRRTLPREYGEIERAGSDITTGVRELYDQTVKELNPRINSIVAKLDRLVPESQKGVKGLLKKVESATSDGSNYASTYNPEAQTEQAIGMAMGDVFKLQQEQSKIKEAKEIVRDKIDLDRHRQSTGVMDSIARSASILSQYTVNVNQAFQKKSLELQLRSYFGQKEYYGKSLTVLQELKAQQDAIVKNTALPEYAKITESERFKERAKNRFIDSLYGEGSFFKKGFDRLKKTAAEFTQGFAQRLDSAAFNLDQVGSMRESIEQANQMAADMGMEGMSKASMAGSAAAGFGMGYVQDKIVEKAQPYVEDSNTIKEKVAEYAKLAVNPGAAISNFRDSEKWKERQEQDNITGKATKFLDFVLGHFSEAEDDPRRAIGTENGLDELNNPAEGFTKKASLSITTVIPGYLSYIHQELVRTRTRRNDAPLMTYDFARGEFTTTSTMQARVVGMFKETVDRSQFGYAVKNAERNFVGDRELDDDDRLELRVFLARLAREPDVDLADVDKVKATAAYRSMSELAQNRISNYLEAMVSSSTFHQQSLKFTSSVKDIRKSMPSLNKEFGSMVSAGYGDHLEKTGLAAKSRSGKRYDIDESAYFKFMEDREKEKEAQRRAEIIASDPAFNGPYAIAPGGYYPSDVNVKTDIRETDPESSLQKLDKKFANSKINPKNAFEGFKKTKLYSYFYDKNKVDDDQQHDGPMAQDVNKNLGEEAAPKGKKIDVQSITASFFSAVKYLGEKYDSLVKETKDKAASDKTEPAIQGRNYLKEIAEHTKKTNQLLLSRPMSGIGIKRHGSKQGKQEEVETTEETKGGYIDMVSKLISKGFTDIRDGIVKPIYRNSRDHVVNPLYGAVKDTYDNNKDAAKEKLGKGYDYVKELGKTAANKIADFATIDVPDGIGWLKGKAQQGWQNLKKQFDDLKDLYLPDGKEPIIRAFKVKSGFYLDETTGEPLTTMKQILECKNNIVDKTGNILLSVEERVDGLYDKYGDQVKGYFGKLLNGAISTGSYMFGKTKDLLKGIKDGSLNGFDAIKGFFKDKSFFKDWFSGFDFGGIGGKEAKDELVNIRDILLGDAEGVRERIKKKGEKVPKGATLDLAESNNTAIDDKDDKEKPGQPMSVADTVSKYTQGTKLGSIFNKLRENLPGFKDKVNKAKDDIKERAKTGVDKLKAKADELEHKGQPFVGPMPQFVGPMPQPNQSKTAAIAAWFASKGKTGKPAESATPSLPEQAMVGPAPELVGPVQPASRKGLLGKANDIKSRLAEGRVGKALGAGKRIGGGLLSGISSLFGSNKDSTDNLTDTPEAAQARDAELKEGEENYDKVKEITAAKKGRVAKKDRAWNDVDGSGSRDGGVEDREDKIEALKKSREKKGAQADLTLRYKSSENVISKMMSMATGFLGGLSGKIGGLFDLTKGILGKLPGLGAIGTAIGGFLKSPLTKLGGLASSGVGLAVRGAAGLAIKGGLAFGGLMMNAGMALGGAAVSALAAPILITAGVAGAAYGAYKLYKYTTRNNANVYDRLRLRQYGFAYNDVVDRFNHIPLQLEAYLEDGRVGFQTSSKEAYLLDKKITNDELLEIAKVKKDDTTAVNNFKEWFNKRFVPVFLSHQTALNGQNNKAKLEGIINLKPIERLKYLEAAKLKDDSVYNQDISPIKELELDVNSTEINAYYDNLLAKDKLDAEKDAKKTPIPAKPEALDKAKQSGSTSEASGDEATKKSADKEAMEKAEALRVQNQKNNQTLANTEAKQDGEPNPTSYGRQMPSVGINNIGRRGVPGKLPEAEGAIKDGTSGMQYLNLAKNVDLAGISPTMLKNFLGMAEEYGSTTGKKIGVNSAKRSNAEQAALHARDPKKAAVPGKSLHEFGLALDINSVDAGELEKLGLMKKYGFTRPVGGEPWHTEPSGIQQDLAEAKRNPAVAEALVAASIRRGGGGYGTLPNAEHYKRDMVLANAIFRAKGTSLSDKAAEAANDASIKVADAAGNEDRPDGSAKQEVTKQASGNVVDIATARDKTKSVQEVTTPWTNEPESKLSSATQPGSTKPAKADNVDDIKAIIDTQAKKAGIDPNLLKVIAATESGLNPKAQAASTSASGLMQFVDRTWREQLGLTAKKYGISPDASPTDPEAAALVGAEYVKGNMKAISSVKPVPNATDVYLAHFLGAGGAKHFFSADQASPAANTMQEAASRNRSVFFDKSGRALSFAEIYKNTENKLKTKAAAFGINYAGFSNEGLKLNSSENQGTGIKPKENKIALTTGNETVTRQAEASFVATPPSRPSPGFSFDDRSAMQRTSDRTESGQPMGGISLSGVEGILSQSLTIHEKALGKLDTIASSLSSEELVKAFATALQAMPKPEGSTKEETVKEKDKVNMGRTSEMKPSALDLRRRSA